MELGKPYMPLSKKKKKKKKGRDSVRGINGIEGRGFRQKANVIL
jgi:hypothetical protein